MRDPVTTLFAAAAIAVAGYGVREYVRLCRERAGMQMATSIIREVRETLVLLQRSYEDPRRLESSPRCYLGPAHETK